jgi:ribosomal protein S4E
MFKNKLMFISLLLLMGLVFNGCGLKETNTQIRDIAYLKFDKASDKEFKVVINDSKEFKLSKCILNQETGGCQDSNKNNMYEVKSGKVNIKIFDDNNNLIRNKDVYIGSNNTFEIGL